MLEQMGRNVEEPDIGSPGPLLEAATREFLAVALPVLAPGREWMVGQREITAFSQYRHLAALNDLVAENPVLRVELGRDYLIAPDVTVGIPFDPEGLFLHAAVSAKWTIRSDRVQNIRHEAVVMIRSRRGRLPHIAAVTAEPMPTRLASIARGTGEIDAVYHVAYAELLEAVLAVGTDEQRRTLDELINQRRLYPLSRLPEVLAAT